MKLQSMDGSVYPGRMMLAMTLMSYYILWKNDERGLSEVEAKAPLFAIPDSFEATFSVHLRETFGQRSKNWTLSTAWGHPDITDGFLNVQDNISIALIISLFFSAKTVDPPAGTPRGVSA
ncbi:hypothetical protein [Paenibacillus harenae]|uniref:hypothetical protein n=1 Tax=Paenibacillus harenae TaxID=306543 RepID=UPI0012EBF2E2|nr:hypothetical protein [Paenibacillus harenae]